MAAQYPYNVDIITPEGQAEILSLWSDAKLGIDQAAFILKMTHAKFLELARQREVPEPSAEAWQMHLAELEAKFRPLVEAAERARTGRALEEAIGLIEDAKERLARIAVQATRGGNLHAYEKFKMAQTAIDTGLVALTSARALVEDGGLSVGISTPDEHAYGKESASMFEGLDPTKPRPDYYLVGDFDHVNPVTTQDILWSWSKGYLTAEAAEQMLHLDETASLEELAQQSGVPAPTEPAISPEEAAVILGDEPVDGDPTFHVRRRVRDARLPSLRQSDVERRKLFEDHHGRPSVGKREGSPDER